MGYTNGRTEEDQPKEEHLLATHAVPVFMGLS